MMLQAVALEKEILIIKERKKENWCKNFFLSCINQQPLLVLVFATSATKNFLTYNTANIIYFLKITLQFISTQMIVKITAHTGIFYFRCPAFIQFKSSQNYFFLLKEFSKYIIFIVTFYNYCSIMQKIKYLPLD